VTYSVTWFSESEKSTRHFDRTEYGKSCALRHANDMHSWGYEVDAIDVDNQQCLARLRNTAKSTSSFAIMRNHRSLIGRKVQDNWKYIDNETKMIRNKFNTFEAAQWYIRNPIEGCSHHSDCDVVEIDENDVILRFI
jgi:hypothetical protein